MEGVKTLYATISVSSSSTGTETLLAAHVEALLGAQLAGYWCLEVVRGQWWGYEAEGVADYVEVADYVSLHHHPSASPPAKATHHRLHSPTKASPGAVKVTNRSHSPAAAAAAAADAAPRVRPGQRASQLFAGVGGMMLQQTDPQL